ncbi:MAG: hypothetical protein AAF517_03755, partial [Planctomycetota bacterium]
RVEQLIATKLRNTRRTWGKRSLLESLARLDRMTPRTASTVEAHLRDGDPQIRLLAALALESAGHPLPPLLEVALTVLDDPLYFGFAHERTHSAADEGVSPAFMVSDGNFLETKTLLWIARLGPKAASISEELERRRGTIQDLSSLDYAIARIQGAKPPVSAARKALSLLLWSPSIILVEEPYWDLEKDMFQLLSELGPDARPALPFLKTLTRFPNPYRDTAIATIEEIDGKGN